MEEKNIEYYKFTTPLFYEARRHLAELTNEQKVAFAKLARKIKPVVRCATARRILTTFNYKVTEVCDSPATISSVSPDGKLQIAGVAPNQMYEDESIVYDFEQIPDKWRILTLKEIADETSEDYRNGFFGYTDGGHDIFKGFCSRPAIVCKTPKLEKICEITTLHSTLSRDIFMSSEAEVLLQIPDILKNAVDAYEVYLPGGVEGDKYYKGYHTARARLFRYADGEIEPDEIKEYYNRISLADSLGL